MKETGAGAPQLTRTDPSRKAHPRQSHAPAKPERNHCDYHEEVRAEARAARVVERTGKRDTVTEKHFRSNLSRRTSWRVVGHAVLYEVNTFLLQYALNRLNILLILAGNANVTLDLAVTVLKNFELKRDTIQTENDVPAR